MGISLTVEECCPVAEIVATYRREGDAVRRSHLQVMWLLLDGLVPAEVSRVTGFGVRWIEKLIQRWNADGLAGLGDRRRGNAGREPVLDAAARAPLAALLEGAPPDGGLWSGRKAAAWMSERLGRPVDAKLGIVYLHRLGFSLQRPRPKHARSATVQERAAFKNVRPAPGLHPQVQVALPLRLRPPAQRRRRIVGGQRHRRRSVPESARRLRPRFRRRPKQDRGPSDRQRRLARQPQGSSSPTAPASVSCRPIRPSCNPPSGSGRSPTRASPTSRSTPSINSPRRSTGDAPPSPIGPTSSRQQPTSNGGQTNESARIGII